jgi:hypothetical protein
VSEHPSRDEIGVLAMAAADDPQRVAFEAHAADCSACTREWRRSLRLAELMGTLAAPPPPSPKALARAQARVHALLAMEPASAIEPKAAPFQGLMVAAAVLVSVVAAFSLSGPPISMYRELLAITTIGVAALLPGFAMRSERNAIAASVAALALSNVLGWLDFTEFPMVAGHAVGCMQMELAIGALPLLAMLGVSRSAGSRASAFQTAAAGASGALAGQGVLLTTCGADESVLHVLVFHVAGVVLGALIGGGLGTLVGRRASS